MGDHAPGPKTVEFLDFIGDAVAGDDLLLTSRLLEDSSAFAVLIGDRTDKPTRSASRPMQRRATTTRR